MTKEELRENRTIETLNDIKAVLGLDEQYIDELEGTNAELELEIKKLTQHLEPQLMTDLLKQVREEVEQEQRIKELEEENAELKADNDARKFAMVMSEKVEKQLREENEELKTRVENQKSFLERIRAKFELGEIDKKEIEGYLESENLTRAKELLKTFMKISEENGRQFDEEVYFEAREFLKE